jgi:hypothetical protein
MLPDAAFVAETAVECCLQDSVEHHAGQRIARLSLN